MEANKEEDKTPAVANNNDSSKKIKGLLAKKFQIKLSETAFTFDKKDYNEEILKGVMNIKKFEDLVNGLNKVIESVWRKKKDNDIIKTTKATLGFTLFSLASLVVSIILLIIVQDSKYNEYCQEPSFEENKTQHYYFCQYSNNISTWNDHDKAKHFYDMNNVTFQFEPEHQVFTHNDNTFFISFSLMTAGFIIISGLTIQNYKRKIKKFQSINTLIQNNLEEYLKVLNDTTYKNKLEFTYNAEALAIEITVSEDFEYEAIEDKEVEEVNDEKKRMTLKKEKTKDKENEQAIDNQVKHTENNIEEKINKGEKLKNDEKEVILDNSNLDNTDLGLNYSPDKSVNNLITNDSPAVKIWNDETQIVDTSNNQLQGKVTSSKSKKLISRFGTKSKDDENK